jgi:hypothetical protein
MRGEPAANESVQMVSGSWRSTSRDCFCRTPFERAAEAGKEYESRAYAGSVKPDFFSRAKVDAKSRVLDVSAIREQLLARMAEFSGESPAQIEQQFTHVDFGTRYGFVPINIRRRSTATNRQ